MYIVRLLVMFIIMSLCLGLERPEIMKHGLRNLSRCKRNHESQNPRVLEKLRKDNYPSRAHTDQLKIVTNLLPNMINKVNHTRNYNPQINALNLRLNPNLLRTHNNVAHILNSDPQSQINIDIPSKIIDLHKDDDKTKDCVPIQTTLKSELNSKITDKKCQVSVETDIPQEIKATSVDNSIDIPQDTKATSVDNSITVNDTRHEIEPTVPTKHNSDFFEDIVDGKHDEFEKHKKIKKSKHKCCQHKSHKTKSAEHDPEVSQDNQPAGKTEILTVPSQKTKINSTDTIDLINTSSNVTQTDKQNQNLNINSENKNYKINITDKIVNLVSSPGGPTKYNETDSKNDDTMDKQDTKDDIPGVTRIEIEIKDKDQRKNETNATIVINNRKIEEILERSKDRPSDSDKNDRSGYWYNEPQNWNDCTQNPYTYQDYDRQNERDYTQSNYYGKSFDCNFPGPDDVQYQLRSDENKFNTPYSQNYQSLYKPNFSPNIPVGYNRVWRTWKNIEIQINKPTDKQLIIELEQNGIMKQLTGGNLFNKSGQSVIRLNGCYNNQNNPSTPYYLYPNARYA